MSGLREAMELLANATPRFVAALGALFLLLYLAAATGVSSFGGALRNRCFSRATGALRAPADPADYGGCAGAADCPAGHDCLPLAAGPGGGEVSFDGVGPALATLMRVTARLLPHPEPLPRGQLLGVPAVPISAWTRGRREDLRGSGCGHEEDLLGSGKTCVVSAGGPALPPRHSSPTKPSTSPRPPPPKAPLPVRPSRARRHPRLSAL